MTLTSLFKTPFPYYGGKSDAAALVWSALGDCEHYVEPFAGSLAVMLRRPHEANRTYHSETVNDADGLLCVGPETRVLRADMRWQSAGSVSVGDSLLAFDEQNGPPQTGIVRRVDRPEFQPPSRMRRWRVTTVLAVHRVMREAYRLRFDDGTTVVASADHQWLAGKPTSGGRGARWVLTKNMRCDASAYRSHVMKLCDVVEQENTADAGWIGGFYDGEGNIRGTGAGWQLTVCQKLGPEADRAEQWLRNNGFAVSRAVRLRDNPKHKPMAILEFTGGMRATLRLLMQTRPERLIRNAIARIDKRSIYARERQVVGLVEKTPLGMVEVIAIETDSHTYIAEGLASHNCNAWRSIQLSPDATAEAASNIVAEADLHARHSALVRWRAETQLEHLMGDPLWHDPVMAGWWIWGMACWIGSGFASGVGPWVVDATGRLVRGEKPGVSRQLPHLGNDGQGVNHAGTREPGVDDGEEFHPVTMPEVRRWFAYLSARLRHVRILNGDWTRACTGGAAKTINVRQGGHAGIFLDPPYATSERDANLYVHDSGTIAADVLRWCQANGPDPRYRIVLAGYDSEHAALEAEGWRVVEWFKTGFLKGGMAQQSAAGSQQKRERLWLSPHCIAAALPATVAQQSLFGGAA